MARPYVTWFHAALALAAFSIDCGHAAKPAQPPSVAAAAAAPRARTITIIGTNDVHGALDRLPTIAGYVNNVRSQRAADGGAVVLIDAGDMFQGTLESNSNEGAAMIAAYNAMGYAAAAVGNHEFDFGPVGPAVIISSTSQDARGSLKMRATEAHFPLLTANILDEQTGARIDWPNMPANTVVEVAGVKIGIIGVGTEATPVTTMPANFLGLKMAPVAGAIIEQAKKVRAAGAKIVVVTAHIGSKCKDLQHPDDLSSCDRDEEIFKVLADVPAGTVDAVIAGHTHAGMAHRIGGVPVIESMSSGRAFGRLDVHVAADGRITGIDIHPPEEICWHGAADKTCDGLTYEGKPVVADAAVQAVVDTAMASARIQRDALVGITLTNTFAKSYDSESQLGDLFADLMLDANPKVDIALTNGGGLRTELPAGALTYGALFEAMPFDNRYATVKLSGKNVRTLVRNNLRRSAGIHSWAGLTAKAYCEGAHLKVELFHAGSRTKAPGARIADNEELTMVTSDFLASGGEGIIAKLKLPNGSIVIDDSNIRDSMAAQLKARGGTLDPHTVFDPKSPRLEYPGGRPVKCKASDGAASDSDDE